MSFVFKFIGADADNYFLMAYNKRMDMNKGVFFYKIPNSFFDEYIFKGEIEVEVITEIEVFVENMYNYLIRDGFLEVINQDEFMNIEVKYEE